MHKGMQGFKSRTPAWFEGPDRVVSDDGFWVVSTLHKERESACASPVIERGLFRFAFRINGSGSGLVVGVADATAEGLLRQPKGAEELRGWGLHLTHGALYTKKPGSLKGVLSAKQLVPRRRPTRPRRTRTTSDGARRAGDRHRGRGGHGPPPDRVWPPAARCGGADEAEREGATVGLHVELGRLCDA